MEIFFALLALCAGNSPVTVGFPSLRPVTRSFDVFFVLHLVKLLINNREAGDLRYHHARYEVTVMINRYLPDVWQVQLGVICKRCDMSVFGWVVMSAPEE